jgi:hypothetical protein
LEEEEPDALEVAAEEDEEREAQTGQEIVLTIYAPSLL